MAKVGRPRKVKNEEVPMPIGFDDKPPVSIVTDETFNAAVETPMVVAEAIRPEESPIEIFGVKFVWGAGKLPDIYFKGNVTGAVLKPMQLVAQLMKAYQLYRLKKRANAENGIADDVIEIKGSELKRVSI